MTATDNQPTPDPELDAALWDLAPLVDGDAGLRELLADARARAQALKAAHKGRVAELDGPALSALGAELNAIEDLLQRTGSYALLRTARDVSDSEASELEGAVEDARAECRAELLFFDLEWVALEDDRAEAMIAGAGTALEGIGHHLRRLRARRPFLLDAAQESILAQTSVQRRSAWQRLSQNSASALTIELDGETLPLGGSFYSCASDPDRARRQRWDAAVTVGIAQEQAVRVSAFNQVLSDWALTDRLRGHRSWLSARNLTSELSDRAVERQLEVIDRRAEVARRWYRLKARLLGVDRLAASDLWAPLPRAPRHVSFAQARQIVCESWTLFDPMAGELAARFFSEGRVDAPIRTNKRGGAFASYSGPGAAPYLLLSFDSRPEDVTMLAHEMGHGIHAELSRGCGALEYEGSIPMAEVASTFSETLVAEQLMARAEDDAERLALLGDRINMAILCVFDTRAQLQGEAALHAHRREHGELNADLCDQLWTAAYVELWQDTVEPQPGYLSGWSFYPHPMIDEPGYNQSYSFGMLTAWSIYARYREVGPAFAQDYLAMLAAGGSRSPADLVAMLGLDLEDPGYWDRGLDMIEELIGEAERLADSTR